MPWSLKIDEESKAPVFLDPEKEGDLPKPVYINSEGKEIALDPVGMYDKIIVMGKSEKELRGSTKRLEGQLSLFTDIEDLPAWKEEADKAVETVKNFNDKEWTDTKKVEKLKEEMKEAHNKKIGQIQESFSIKEGDFSKTLSRKDKQIRQLMVSNKFATHPLFSGKNRKTNLPPEIAETYFGKNFKVEEDKDTGELTLISYYTNGDPVYSFDNPGELAEFHEAMFSIFEVYPGKDDLLRAADGGSGGTGGTGTGDDGEYDELKDLEKRYAAAMEAKDSKLSIALKNQLWRIRQKAAA